jgi:hypothetical protein
MNRTPDLARALRLTLSKLEADALQHESVLVDVINDPRGADLAARALLDALAQLVADEWTARRGSTVPAAREARFRLQQIALEYGGNRL